jgi:hypothetical protein
MLRQLADGPDRPLLGPCGQASELPVFDHALASSGHGSPSCASGGGMETSRRKRLPEEDGLSIPQDSVRLRGNEQLRGALSSTTACSGRGASGGLRRGGTGGGLW